MIEWFTDPFQLSFMQRAVVGGAMAAVTGALVGTWVVLRGMSFMGDALAHGVLPGIALALLAGVDPVLGAMAGASVMLAGIGVVQRRSHLPEDTGIGLLFVGMLAAGVIVISRSRSFKTQLVDILFGDLLGVDRNDLVLLLATMLVTLATVALLYRGFLSLSFNADKARLLGLAPRFAHVAMLALIGLSITTSFRAVGTLLVFGLIVGPPATASLLVRRLPATMAVAALLGVACVLAGLLVSYHASTAASATIAGLAVGLFFVVLAAREVVAVFQRRRLAATHARSTVPA